MHERLQEQDEARVGQCESGDAVSWLVRRRKGAEGMGRVQMQWVALRQHKETEILDRHRYFLFFSSMPCKPRNEPCQDQITYSSLSKHSPPRLAAIQYGLHLNPPNILYHFPNEKPLPHQHQKRCHHGGRGLGVVDSDYHMPHASFLSHPIRSISAMFDITRCHRS